LVLTLKRNICKKCLRPQVVCFCHTITSIVNCWPVHIIQHYKEKNHSIGTARIAQLSLNDCKTYLSNNSLHNDNLVELINFCEPLLVYPGEESINIEEIDSQQIRPLIFLDGSWRKTRRLIYENPYLNSIPKISFTRENLPRYRIRKAPNENAYSTLEAIATVLATLENDDKKYQPLLNSMDWMIDKQIEFMRENVYENNYLKK